MENIGSKKRLIQYTEYKRISKREFGKKIGLSHSFLNSGSNIGTDNVEIIISNYPDINLEWLITGRGPMLRPVEGSVSQALGESQAVYSKAVAVKCAACEERKKVIQVLESRLADKDKQIGALENNLGMVISEKSEVIKMKNQMLEIQAEKIAELEDFKKMQKEQMRKQRSA